MTNENGYKFIYYYRYCDYSLEKGVVVRGSKPQFTERACMGCCFQLSAMDCDHRLVAFDGMDVLRTAGCRAAAYRIVPEEGIFYKVIYVNANIK